MFYNFGAMRWSIVILKHRKSVRKAAFRKKMGQNLTIEVTGNQTFLGFEGEIFHPAK